MEFKPFPKIPRLSRKCIITEKIDGTNGVIYFAEDGQMLVGSRNKWLRLDQDNYGFCIWAHENYNELIMLGPGFHYGEWWGQGIQRNYGLKEKRFSLFNVHRWSEAKIRPKCCGVVPILYQGLFKTEVIDSVLEDLKSGSIAVPGFMKPEGIVIFHTQSGYLFKKTIENDEKGKEE